jgi:hypothetical protein
MCEGWHAICVSYRVDRERSAVVMRDLNAFSLPARDAPDASNLRKMLASHVGWASVRRARERLTLLSAFLGAGPLLAACTGIGAPVRRLLLASWVFAFVATLLAGAVEYVMHRRVARCLERMEPSPSIRA